MRQIIIARKDLNMNPGKLASQVAHASLAFISRTIARIAKPIYAKMYLADGYVENPNVIEGYEAKLELDIDVYEQWFNGIFTKTICEAKNYNQLMKAVAIAQELGLKENTDYFLIWDACLTDLTPEMIDENGVGRTLTCIGFRPLQDEIAWKISKKFQLYK